MLLWEALGILYGSNSPMQDETRVEAYVERATRGPRLPHDKRCAALTQSGRQCRGRICKDSDFCAFHDPKISQERRRLNAAKGGRGRHRLSHLPDGYLRKLTTRAAVGNAMDRLYREIRLGIITPQMGTVLFDVLNRILDSGLVDAQQNGKRPSGRAKADRLRPKLNELLTRTERAAWQRAVANAPTTFLHGERTEPHTDETSRQKSEKPVKVPLQAAS